MGFTWETSGRRWSASIDIERIIDNTLAELPAGTGRDTAHSAVVAALEAAGYEHMAQRFADCATVWSDDPAENLPAEELP